VKLAHTKFYLIIILLFATNSHAGVDCDSESAEVKAAAIACDDFESNFLLDDWGDRDSLCRECSPPPGELRNKCNPTQTEIDPDADCEGISTRGKYNGDYSLRLMIEEDEVDCGYPRFNFSDQSASEWTHLRWYMWYNHIDHMNPAAGSGQCKGPTLKGSYDGGTVSVSFQIHGYYDTQYRIDGKSHFGFHWYNPEEWYTICNEGTEVYPIDQVGEWHCYEFALQPSTGSLKYWFDGTLLMDYTGLGYPGGESAVVNYAWILAYSAGAAPGMPSDRIVYTDNIVISNSYIGTFEGTTSSSTSSSSTSTSTTSIPDVSSLGKGLSIPGGVTIQ